MLILVTENSNILPTLICHSSSKLIGLFSTRYSTELRTSMALVIGSLTSEMAEGAVLVPRIEDRLEKRIGRLQ